MSARKLVAWYVATDPVMAERAKVLVLRARPRSVASAIRCSLVIEGERLVVWFILVRNKRSRKAVSS